MGVIGKEGKKQAYAAWHALVAFGREQAKERLTINNLTKAFLQDAKERVSVGCYLNYSNFVDALLPAFGKRLADELTTNAIETFARKQSTWGNTYRSQFLGFVVSVYRWAMRERMIEVNPIANVKRPPKSSRGVHAILTAEEHQTLIAHADDQFADFLQLLWHTGCRPSEIAGLTADEVKQSVNGVIILTNHKTAHHGHARMLILNDVAMAIVKRRAEQAGEGLLFAGLNGRLTARAVGGRMEHLCRRAGLRNIIAYGYRHTFATDALSKGIADTHVASLLGHASTTMLHKHYSHLTSRTNLLRDVAKQIR